MTSSEDENLIRLAEQGFMTAREELDECMPPIPGLPRAGDETIVCIKATKDGRYIAYNPYGRFSTAFVIEATVPEAYDALQELIARLAFYDQTLEIIGDELKEIAPRRYPENG